MPLMRAMVLAGTSNSSVIITAVGMPFISNSIPSCKLHWLQEPQSPMARTAASHSSVICLTKSGGAGRVASGLENRTIRAGRASASSREESRSRRLPALIFVLSTRARVTPSETGGSGGHGDASGWGLAPGVHNGDALRVLLAGIHIAPRKWSGMSYRPGDAAAVVDLTAP